MMMMMMMMMKRTMLILVTMLSACTPESKDTDLARCDRIAEQKVHFFANADNAGTVRQLFLAKCVLGPDKAYTEHGQRWVECEDAALTGAEFSNCEKEFDHAIKMDKIEEVRAMIEEGVRAYLCKDADKDAVEEYEGKISALTAEAKALGASESEIPTISDFSTGLDRIKFCAAK